MGKIFNKGLEEYDKTDWILKRIKNVECKNEEQLKASKEQVEKQIKVILEDIPNTIGLLKDTF